jgi:hypothetical protein
MLIVACGHTRFHTGDTMTRKTIGIIPLVVLLLGTTGIVLLTHKTTYTLGIGSQLLLGINTSAPEQVQISVLDREPQQPDREGRVVLDIHGFCTRSDYVFGIKYSGDTPWEKQSIQVIKEGAVRRMLSIKEIESLPKDSNGYHELDF